MSDVWNVSYPDTDSDGLLTPAAWQSGHATYCNYVNPCSTQGAASNLRNKSTVQWRNW